MSPLQALRLYQVIANNGAGIRSAGIIAVQDHKGQLLQRFPRKTEVKFDAESIFLIKYLLSQVVARGTAKAIGESFPDALFAGKTGTTNDLKDSWYAGFGGDKLAVVWIGRDDNQPSQLTGASGALKVWQDLFRQLDEASVKLQLPEGLVWGYKPEGFFSVFSRCDKYELVPFFVDQLPSEYQVCEP